MAVKQDLGNCRFCGEHLTENKAGWGCSDRSCGAFIFKEDAFFKKLFNRKQTKRNALTLLKGGTITLNDVVIKGKKCNAKIAWGKKEEGSRFPYGYELDLDFGNSFNK